MPIIDAHQHFWWHGRRTHVWPEAVGTQLDRDFTPADLRQELDTAGIDGSVLIQSLNDLDETREYLQIAKENAFVRGVVGWVPLDEPAGDGRRARGVRRHAARRRAAISSASRPRAPGSLSRRCWSRCACWPHSVSPSSPCPINAEQFAHLLDIAERLPDLRLIIDHLGRPPVPEGGWEPVGRDDHAGRPGCRTCRSSSRPASTSSCAGSGRRTNCAAIPITSLRSFGARRVMAASNWPVLLISASYQHAWSGIVSLLSGCSEAERAEILGGTAARVYRL